MGGGPAGHIEEIFDRQRDAVERRQVRGRAGPRDRIRRGGGGCADIVAGAVAERVRPGVELIYPAEVAAGHPDRAHLLAADGRGELDGRGERVNRVCHDGPSFPSGCLGVSVAACPGLRLGRMSRRRHRPGAAHTMAVCDPPSRLLPPRRCGTSRSRPGRARRPGSRWPGSAPGRKSRPTCRWSPTRPSRWSSTSATGRYSSKTPAASHGEAASRPALRPARSGRAGLRTLLAAAFVVQVAPSLWTAYRTACPSGISAGTWTLILGELLCFLVYGWHESDPRLIALGATGVTASALMLARIFWTRRLSSQARSTPAQVGRGGGRRGDSLPAHAPGSAQSPEDSQVRRGNAIDAQLDQLVEALAVVDRPRQNQQFVPVHPGNQVRVHQALEDRYTADVLLERGAGL